MGGNFRDDRKLARDREDRDATRDRPARSFDTFVRDKDPVDGETRPRNGLGRNKLDPWRSSDAKDSLQSDRRERDRTKSWRERDKEAEPSSDDRGNGRTLDRRWGRERDHKVEREPEWLDEPHVDQHEAHTQQDFQKWMEQMKAAKSGASASTKSAAATGPEAAPEAATEAPKRSAPAPVKIGPDKFFMAFGGGSSVALDAASPSEPSEVPNKPKPAPKSSRFTSFFAQPHQDGRVRSEASTPLAGPPTNSSAPGAGPALASPPPPEEERQAFQQLLAKLQKQSIGATSPASSPFAAPQQQGVPMDASKKSAIASPDPQQLGERREAHLGAAPSHHAHEIVTPRPQQQSTRPDQLLQDLVCHHHCVSSQGTLRPETNPGRNNSNTEFLMNLMRAAPELQRADQQARVQKPGSMPPFSEREADFLARESRVAQRQLRPQPPPGFPIEESFHGTDQEQRQNQPTQILQRPHPPGLDQMPPDWMARGGQMPPPQQRGPMIPPPGLAGGPSRSMLPPHMFPPNFPPAGVPPPEAMGPMLPRNMPLPPPGFNAPPHGFGPPCMGGFNGPPGPESHMFSRSPFEARGIPPSNGRGAGFSLQ